MGATRDTPPWLRALGGGAPPPSIRLDSGVRYALERVYKHDFFAFTACYASARGERVVLKLGRRAGLFRLPLGWLGRLLARHESRALAALDGIPVVPRFTGRWGTHGVTHVHVPGRTLRRQDDVPDGFFDELGAGLREVHRRGWAVVDLEKLDNVVVGEDGRPYLVDFQIAWHWPARLGGRLAPMRWLAATLRRGDFYHLAKLQRRARPDLMSPAELAAADRRPWPIRLHGWLARPFIRLRRRLLRRLDPGRVQGERGRVDRDVRPAASLARAVER